MATYEWESKTLGQNAEIQKIVSAAAQASELVNTNIGLAKSGLQLAQAFLLGVLNPKVLILNAIADEIDNFVNDFRNTGFFILEVTPTGKEIIPKDADGNPIKLLLSAPLIAANYTAAAAAGQTAEFLQWTVDTLGIENYEVSGAPNASYAVATGKAIPASARSENANDDTLATTDPLFGIFKFTPSQVIAQTIAAMDDQLDERRPQFSTSAEVGAVMVIVAYKDMTTNLPNIKTAVGALVSFFGGENGLFTKGFQKIGNLLAAALGQLEDPTKNNVTLTIEQGSGVMGTEDDTIDKALKNFKDQFEVNDFVIGPRAKFGARAIGYVSKVNSTSTPNTNQVYQNQELVITGATELDAIAFRSLGAGATLTLGSFKVVERKYVDDNSGKVVSGGFYNGYRYLQEIEIVNGECIANTKVERKGSDPLLTVLKTENVAEDIGGRLPDFKRKVVVGKIETPKVQKAPPPNFKAAKLEDLIGGFTTFFSAIDTLSNTLRNIAGDSSTAIEEIIKFLDSKIKELDEINKSLQAILKLFTEGLPKGGVYVLTVPPTVGGNDLIKSALSSASNRPPDDLDFAVGFFMMGGGPSMKVLNKLLNSA